MLGIYKDAILEPIIAVTRDGHRRAIPISDLHGVCFISRRGLSLERPSLDPNGGETVVIVLQKQLLVHRGTERVLQAAGEMKLSSFLPRYQSPELLLLL